MTPRSAAARALSSFRHALWRSVDGGASFVDVWQVEGVVRGIEDIVIDVARGQVLVVTIDGLVAGPDPGGAAQLTLRSGT